VGSREVHLSHGYLSAVRTSSRLAPPSALVAFFVAARSSLSFFGLLKGSLLGRIPINLGRPASG
jgi:hypothetical protein